MHNFIANTNARPSNDVAQFEMHQTPTTPRRSSASHRSHSKRFQSCCSAWTTVFRKSPNFLENVRFAQPPTTRFASETHSQGIGKGVAGRQPIDQAVTLQDQFLQPFLWRRIIAEYRLEITAHHQQQPLEIQCDKFRFEWKLQ